MSRLIKLADRKKFINTRLLALDKFDFYYFRSKFIRFMDTLVYALRDFFEFLFKFMPAGGEAVNLFFIFVFTIFTFYWIREMFRNPDKAKN